MMGKKWRTGKDIKDELCYCGALKSQHNDGDYGIEGHGSCTETGCQKFTWKEFIFKTQKEKESPRKYTVLLDGKIMCMGGTDNITFSLETAKSMAKTLGGKIAEIQITEVEAKKEMELKQNGK